MNNFSRQLLKTFNGWSIVYKSGLKQKRFVVMFHRKTVSHFHDFRSAMDYVMYAINNFNTITIGG